MEDIKLPDLSRIRGTKQDITKLPPQKSAVDTSNWENRNFSAPTLITEREFEFIVDEPEPILNPYLLQEARKEKYPTKIASD